VAVTRARDRLILSGFSDKLKAGTAAFELGAALGLDRASDGVLPYTAADGSPFEALVSAVPVAEVPRVPEEPFDPAVVPEPLVPIRVKAGRPRHSATELMTFGRCPRRHWFKYVVGLKEPALDERVADGRAAGELLDDVGGVADGDGRVGVAGPLRKPDDS
jgi:hypothetical protein